MLVGFLHVGPDASLATLMVKSAKRFGYELLQMTDEETPAVEGVNFVFRLPWNKRGLMLYRMQHLAAIREPIFVVDTDILFVKDVSDLWEREFDAALCKRTNAILDRNGVDIAKLYPYNAGVMACREPRFWDRAYEVCKILPQGLKEWYGDQESIKWASRDFSTLELDCDEWNYSPNNPSDIPATARILHCKGGRKAWMPSFATAMSSQRLPPPNVPPPSLSV
jgi:hypothetical protein